MKHFSKIFLLLIFVVGFPFILFAGGDPQFKTSVVTSPTGAGTVYTEINGEATTKTIATKAIDTGGSQSNAIAYVSASEPNDPSLVFEKWTARRNAESAGTWAAQSWTSYIKNATAPIIASSTDEDAPDWTEFTAVYTTAGAVRVKANDESRGEVRISKVTNAEGDQVVLTAIPCSFTGVFTGWRYEPTGEIVSTDLNDTIIITNENKGTYTAVFEPFNVGNGCYVMFRHGLRGDYLGLLGNNDDVSSSQRFFRNSILLGSNERVHASPAFVLYMTGTPDTHHNLFDIDLAAQGTSIKKNPDASSGELSFYKITGKYYQFRGEFYSMVGFMCDTRSSDGEAVALIEEGLGKMYHPGAYNGASMNNTPTGSDQYLWEIVVMTENDTINYFGALPSANTNLNGGYWTTMYAAFPFKCLDGVRAFVVSSVNKDGKLQLTEISSGIVPANTPVLLRCDSIQAVNNRLFPVNQDVAAYAGTNYLTGEIWLKNYEEDESTYRKAFNAATMRTLSQDSCAFVDHNITDIKNDGTTGVLEYIANNTAYLDLSTISEGDRQTTYSFGGSISPVVSAPLNHSISVTIEAPTTASTIEYRIGENGQWQTYTGPFSLNETATVYARFTDTAFGTTYTQASYEFEAGAGFIGEGYYRVMNYDTHRYIDITNNEPLLSSISLTNENVSSHPGSVIRITKAENTEGYDMQAQGMNTADIHTITVEGTVYNIPQPVHININGADVSTLYNAYVHSDEYNLDAYFQDANGSGTINADMDAARSGDYDNTKWYVIPFTREDIGTNYFTVAPQVQDNDYKYATLTVDFNYEIITEGVEAFYATAVDVYGNITQSNHFTNGDIIPAGEPMILRWPASRTADIQLLPTLDNAQTVTGNVLQRAIDGNGQATYFETPATGDKKYFGTLSLKDGAPGFFHDVDPTQNLIGNRAYTANEVYEFDDLAELAASTHLNKRHIYTGENPLIATYYHASLLGGKPSILAKDNNLWTPKDENTNELPDYVKNKGFQSGDYDQSHWIKLQLPEAQSHSNGQRLTNIYGILLDNTNLRLDLLEQPTSVSGTSYTPNSYVAANFNKAGNTDVWLENPQQPMQLAKIRYVKWDAAAQAFVMPDKSFDFGNSATSSSWTTVDLSNGPTGGFKVNLSYAPTAYNATSKLHDGRIYDISSAIIKREDTGASSPINSQMTVYPIEISEVIPAYTLADALADNTIGTGPNYIIDIKRSDLTCVDIYMSTQANQSSDPAQLYCKETSSTQIWPTPAEGQWDFLKYTDDPHFKAVGDCEQSFWIKLIGNKLYYDNSNIRYGIQYKLEGIRGYFIDKENPEFKLTYGESYYTYYVSKNSNYTLADNINYVIPANFIGTQTDENGKNYGLQLADNGKTYFFMQPRPMEIVHFTWAVWDKDQQAFVIPKSQTVDGTVYNEAGLHGGVRADFSLCGTDLYLTNGGAKITAADLDAYDGQAFSFRALVKRTPHGNGAPRRAEIIDGDPNTTISSDWIICPLDFDPENTEQIVTAIRQVDRDAKVTGVEYIDIAGRRSATPWSGVNIVVTRYDNDAATTTKRLF